MVQSMIKIDNDSLNKRIEFFKIVKSIKSKKRTIIDILEAYFETAEGKELLKTKFND